MIRNTNYLYIILALQILSASCKKATDTTPPPRTPETFKIVAASINGNAAFMQYGVSNSPIIRIAFTAPVNRTTVATGITLTQNPGSVAVINATYQNGDSVVVLQPYTPLSAITKYILTIKNIVASQRNTLLTAATSISFNTAIDSSNKFPLLNDSLLLNKIQQQTLKYFTDFGHPVSGLARERNSSGDVVTTGGSGFGIMAIITGINRNFITKNQGFAQVQKMVGFLKNTAQKVHGAFPHWLNGATGAIVPFSDKDNGADLVETAYLMQGLLTARQYFNGAGAEETTLRNDINILWNNVEWDWFRQGNQHVLYWHYSENNLWAINQKIQGWNETLITYILAASSATHSIPATVYSSGWAGAPGFVNGNTYFGYQLPLGPDKGGPLFFSHYSFLGINPTGLSDAYANYTTQTKNHTLINYNYCVTNPQNNYGYSSSCWGLTASDIEGGYTASSPTNDVSVIAPTAAISSLPYTPPESMQALKFFYYTLGDKLWGDYGFYDAFSLKNAWFANSTLAIDQGPIIVMIENYRTGLLWKLFTSCPEVKTGMLSLGFKAAYL